jgi:CRISPR-associated protein Csd2
MFEHDRSASRGEMAVRKLFVFKHLDRLGNAPAHKLFESVRVTRTGDLNAPPRKYGDYSIAIDKPAIPNGVELVEKV